MPEMNMEKNYKSLKSGTDIRGTAVDGVPGEPITLTDEAIADIAYGFAQWLYDNVTPIAEKFTVAVGHDSRISADRIKSVLIEVLFLIAS